MSVVIGTSAFYMTPTMITIMIMIVITATTMTTMTMMMIMVMMMMMMLMTVMMVQWNPSLQTAAYKGQFRLSRRKAHKYSLIRTTDTFLRSESQTLTYHQPRFATDTGFQRTFYFLVSHNHLLIVYIVPCWINDRFVWVNTILLKKEENSVTCMFDFDKTLINLLLLLTWDL